MMQNKTLLSSAPVVRSFHKLQLFLSKLAFYLFTLLVMFLDYLFEFLDTKKELTSDSMHVQQHKTSNDS